LSKVYVFQKRDKKFESKMKRTTKKNWFIHFIILYN
jgi:hypothetical protein